MISAILDHLWQSTLLALGVGLLTAAFRRARAAVRHALWFVASAKFLVPFAALAALGRFLAPAVRSPADATLKAVFIEQAAEPFSHVHATAFAVYAAPHFDPAPILGAVWALGFAVVLMVWMVSWAKVRSAMRSATPLALPAPMPVLASSSQLEPGLVGFWRPVLLAPATLFDHLARPEIDAIVAHEACHRRRRDNLTAAIHMLVEALFWFHPLVWWIGARLIEERERACDEAVVRSGHDRAAYARSLVECCRHYLQSPLSCVAGASGSYLKARLARIMTAPPSAPLSSPAKAVLLAAGVCAFASPVAAGLLTSPVGREATARATAMVSTFAPSPDDLRSAVSRHAAASAPERGQAARAIAPEQKQTAAAPDPGVAQADSPPPDLAPDNAAPQPMATQALQVVSRLPIGGAAAAGDPSSPAKAIQAAAPVATPAILQTTAVAPPRVEISRKTDAVAADPDRPVCQTEAITGSRFVKRFCLTGLQWKEQQRRLFAFESQKSLDPSGFPAATDTDGQ